MPEPHDKSHYEAKTRANERAVLDAESKGLRRVDAVPMKMTFEFTGDCNLHCFFCDCEFNRNEFRKKGVHRFSMDEQTFRSMAETAFPHATVVNPTVVGEPFTFPYFDLLVEYADRYAVKLELVTNGMLLKSPRLEKVTPLMDRLIMSFDGGTKETFEHCRTGAKFDVVIENLRNFRDLRRKLGMERELKFHFAVTLMRENVEELSRIIEWAHELDVDEVNVSHLMVFTKDLKGSSLLGHRELSDRCIKEASERARELGVFLTAPTPFETDAEITNPSPEADITPSETTAEGLGSMRPRQDIPTTAASAEVPAPQVSLLAHESAAPHWAPERYWCKFAWREVFIGITGDVAPCCHQNRPVVGNVFRDDWDAIWNGLEYQELRAGLFDKKPRPYCASCSLLAEQGLVDYQDETYMFDDRYPDQSRADIRPERPRRGES